MFKSLLHPLRWALLRICLCARRETELSAAATVFTILSLFAVQWAGNFLFITTSFMTWRGGSKNHITLSCTRISMNSLNQHFCWGKVLFGKWGASRRRVCRYVFPAGSPHGLKYLSKYSSRTLAMLFRWAGRWVQIATSRDTEPTLCSAADFFSGRALVYQHSGATFKRGEISFKLG